MSLRMLLPGAEADALLRSWPAEPYVVDRSPTELDGTITPALLDDYVTSGCVPAAEIAAVKAPNPSLNRDAFMTNGRTDPVKLAALRDNGFTLRLGNLQRVIPFMAGLSRGIQAETGYSNYAHAFLTPVGEQGLRHHWDQQLAVIVQLGGVKTWPLWRPPVEAPMRHYNESWRVWRPEYVAGWEAAGPDLEVALAPGQALVLPRGWVHNPHCRDASEESVHLTVAIRERTPYWLCERLLDHVLADPAFRQVLQPDDVTGEGLGTRLWEARGALARFVWTMCSAGAADSVREAALTECEYTT
jgi:hypothetical protein